MDDGGAMVRLFLLEVFMIPLVAAADAALSMDFAKNSTLTALLPEPPLDYLIN